MSLAPVVEISGPSTPGIGDTYKNYKLGFTKYWVTSDESRAATCAHIKNEVAHYTNRKHKGLATAYRHLPSCPILSSNRYIFKNKTIKSSTTYLVLVKLS